MIRILYTAKRCIENHGKVTVTRCEINLFASFMMKLAGVVVEASKKSTIPLKKNMGQL